MKGLTTDTQQIYIDGYTLYNAVSKLDSDVCRFDKLFRAMRILNVDQLMAHYIRNLVKVNAALAALPMCMPDYQECGKGVGMLFRMLVGWGLS